MSELEVLLDEAVANSGICSFIVNPRQFSDRAPTVAKFLRAVSGTKPGSGRLILLAGGAFAPKDAEIALRKAIQKKLEKDYGKIKRDRGLDSLQFLRDLSRL